MDSRTVLDYALFQLTPTRTRCDLVIFYGKKSEKLASGLLEPFLTHLQSAKDQICKGGYSITLRPHTSDASWFTKSTLERFVRFVSTPEILERFASIEREIDQIENSIELNKINNRSSEPQVDRNSNIPATSSKSEFEFKCSSELEPEDRPRLCMQRALESRKAILKKEREMAYARALVSGFQMDCIFDLVSFSDAFGASRLRDACINFIILCNKKNDDKIWMDEAAAMEEYSHSEFSCSQTPGIILAAENIKLVQNWLPKTSLNDSITSHETLDTDEGTDNCMAMESKMQQANGVAPIRAWGSHPQYMQNAQSPMFQQSPQYPGYVFQGMQFAEPHNPSVGMQWPSNFGEFSMHPDKSRTRHHNTIYDESTGTDNSISGTESSREEHELTRPSGNKTRRKQSSRKVVIRNINYITSNRNDKSSHASEYGSSGRDLHIESDSLKQPVEEAVVSLKRHHKISAGKNKARDKGKKPSNGWKCDSVIETTRSIESEEDKKEGNWDMFQNLLMRDVEPTPPDMDSKIIDVQQEHSVETPCPEENLSKPRYAADAFLVSEMSSGNGFQANKNKFGNTEDLDGVVNCKDHSMIHCDLQAPTDHFSVATERKPILIDDSFMVKSQLSDVPLNTRHASDFIMVSEIIGSDQHKNNMENLKGNVERVNNDIESDDVGMMVGCDASMELVRTSWNSEMDFGTENIRAESLRGQCITEANYSVDAAPIRNSTGAKSKSGLKVDANASATKSKSGYRYNIGKSKIPPSGNRKIKNKAEEEEENRRKMEDLLIQRQKRIAERSAVKDFASEAFTKFSKERTKNTVSVKTEKLKHKSSKDEDKGSSQKPVMKSSTITRLASVRTSAVKTLTTNSKPVKTQKAAAKESVGMKTSLSKRNTSDKGTPTNKSKGHSKPVENRKAAPKESVGMNTSLSNRNLSDKGTPTIKSKGHSSAFDQSRKVVQKESARTTTPTLKKTKDNHQRQKKANLSDKKMETNKLKGNSSDASGRDHAETISSVRDKSTIERGTLCREKVKKNNTIMESDAVNSTKLIEVKVLSAQDEYHNKISSHKDLPTLRDPSAKIKLKGDACDNFRPTFEPTAHSSSEGNLSSTPINLDCNGVKKNKHSLSPEVRKVHFYTPPPNSGTDPEMNHYRKKWHDDERSPKALKGFRKLIFFGRRI